MCRRYVKKLNLTFDPRSPEVEAGVERLVALFLVQTSEGVFGQAALHEPVQVAVPLDQDADDASLWSTEEMDSSQNLPDHTFTDVLYLSTMLSYLYFVLLSTPLHFRRDYCTFYFTTFI